MSPVGDDAGKIACILPGKFGSAGLLPGQHRNLVSRPYTIQVTDRLEGVRSRLGANVHAVFDRVDKCFALVHNYFDSLLNKVSALPSYDDVQDRDGQASHQNH
jgi:hypothetical protein